MGNKLGYEQQQNLQQNTKKRIFRQVFNEKNISYTQKKKLKIVIQSYSLPQNR